MVKINTTPFYRDTGTLYGEIKHYKKVIKNTELKQTDINLCRGFLVFFFGLFVQLFHRIKLSNLPAVNTTAVNSKKEKKEHYFLSNSWCALQTSYPHLALAASWDGALTASKRNRNKKKK